MNYGRAVREFIRLYEEAGGNLGTDPVAAVHELFAAYSQARVFATEINEMFSAERTRTLELEQALENLRQSHSAIEQSEERFRTLISNASDVVLVVDGDGRVTYVTPSVGQVFGCTEDELLGVEFASRVLPQDRAKLSLALLSARRDPGQSVTVRFRIPDRDGEVRFIEAALSDMGETSPVQGIVLNGRDVTEREILEDNLRHTAYRDPLTNLPNRGLFTSHLETVWPQEGAASSSLALLLVDLDKFKLVNDTRGHAVGDQVLQEVARLLVEIAPAGSFISRFGGDEFAMLIRATDPTTPAHIAKQIVQAFAEAQLEVRSVSVGVATPGSGGDTPFELLRSADLALYQAKRQGRGSFAIFDPELDSLWIERSQMEAELMFAARYDQLRLVYQPIVEMPAGRVVAAEALVRWTHPERGEVSPAIFIPLAEESDTILEIGEWVLREGIRQLALWEEDPEGDAPRLEYLSINVSAAELRHPHYPDRVEELIRDAGIAPERIQLELTETLLAQDGNDIIRRLEELKRLGVRLAIDDFGTGYSSLSYLSRMPVDVMKVDRSFVSGMLTSPRVESVVRATISLASALDLKIVAEGVETTDQQDQLLRFGDILGQGYLYSRPLSAGELTQFCATPTDARSRAELEFKSVA